MLNPSGGGNVNSRELSLLIFIAINLPSRPFLGCHHGFHIFFTLAFLEAIPFSAAWLFFDYIVIHKYNAKSSQTITRKIIGISK